MSEDKICIDRDMLKKMLKMLKELNKLIITTKRTLKRTMNNTNKNLKKYYDELDLYILTLEIMLEENEEDRKVVATARNLEELKKALEYDG